MTDTDDLFEFGDLDDTDSLEIDLDELFGDLEMLAIDLDVIESAPAEQVLAEATPAPVNASAVAAPAAAPAAVPAPVATQATAPQSSQENQVLQPVAPAAQPQAHFQQPPFANTGVTSKLRLTKTTAAIVFASIVTLANVAVTMGGPSRPTVQTPPVAGATQLVNVPTPFQYDNSAVQGEIEVLRAEVEMLRSQGSPTKPIPASYTKGGHPAFDDVSKSLLEGNFVVARQTLYGLLAIVDRFDTYERDAIEATASYMLADSWRMEAEMPTTVGVE